MKRSEFKRLTAEKLIFLDGATGSNLMKRGMPAGACPEKWILEHEDVFLGLQREYVEAGSHILYAPTFTANRVKLKEYGLQEKIVSINTRLVALSKKAACGRAFVAADLTMTGQQLYPIGKMDFEELINVYKEQIRITRDAGADLIVVETMMSLQETRAALIAAKETCDLPVMVTLTFEGDGKTLYGTDAVTAAVTLEKLGADAIGANCSTGPDKMLEVITQICQVVSVPVIAKPNAGLPSLNEQGETVYDMKEPEFAAGMEELVKAGASIVGGCCGTSPSYIKALTEAFCGKEASIRKEQLALKGIQDGTRYLTSERQTIAFDLDAPFMVVGERINPTGKKKLQQQFREGNLEMALDFAREQEECGAALLDVNVGMSGIDEKEMMLKALEEVTLASSLPLSLDSSHVEVLEAALRRYPGRALINSISAESGKMEQLLLLAKKYGAMFILLPLSDEGLPSNLEEKIANINKVANRAFELGLTKEDIIVDGLAATVGADREAAKEVLRAVRYCRENGFATICGLSNISFGLPERSFVNTAFLTMAIQEGLTMAIANPCQDLLMNTAFAADLLMNKEGADIRYIERMELYREKTEKALAARQTEGAVSLAALAGAAHSETKKTLQTTAQGSECTLQGTAQVGTQSPENTLQRTMQGSERILRDAMQSSAPILQNAAQDSEHSLQNPAQGLEPVVQVGTQSPENTPHSTAQTKETTLQISPADLSQEQIYQDVLKGSRRQIKEHTKAAVEQGRKPQEILDTLLLPAINMVGELFDKGKYFLPQLIASAEAMKLSIEYLEPLLAAEKEQKEMPTVVIATVAGDIHDIGKNLVAMMFKNYGFRVIDLGKDVSKERIIEAAIEHHASIIALSALMTTTMQEMKHVVDYAKEKQVSAKIMIGGAVITKEYAKEIGADAYSKDAADAVRVAGKLLGL